MRNRTIDIARGIGILSIIVGHFGISYVTRVVYTYHIPLFYLFTGYFLKREELVPFIRKKARGLLVPYLVTCIAIIAISEVVSLLQGKGISGEWILRSLYGAGSDYKSPVQPIGAIWFLWATFWGSILLQVGLRFRSALRIVYILSLFILGLSTSRVFWLPLSIQAGCCAVLFMYVGYCAKDIRLHKDVEALGVAMAALAWISFIHNFQSFYLVRNDFGRGWIDIMASLCGCYVVVIVSRLIDRNPHKLAEVLSLIGRHSIIILCVHLIEMDLIDWWAVVEALESMGITSLVCQVLAVCMKFLIIIGMTYLITKSRKFSGLFALK